MSRRISLTIEEHRVLAVELHAMRDRLVDLTAALSSRYPKRVSAQARKAYQAVDHLRYAFEGEVARAHPGALDERRLYFPPPDPPPWVVEARKVGGVA
jgi:hypothetical protein